MLRRIMQQSLAAAGFQVTATETGDQAAALLESGARPQFLLSDIRIPGRLNGLEVAYQGRKIPCRFSCGWTDYKPGETPQELLNRADLALYTEKRAGKTANKPAENSAQPLQSV